MQSRGFESHPSNMSVIFFPQSSGKYWVHSANTHRSKWLKPQNLYSLFLMQISIYLENIYENIYKVCVI